MKLKTIPFKNVTEEHKSAKPNKICNQFIGS